MTTEFINAISVLQKECDDITIQLRIPMKDECVIYRKYREELRRILIGTEYAIGLLENEAD